MRNLKTVNANFMLKCLERIYRKHPALFVAVVSFLFASVLSSFVPWEMENSTINAVFNSLSPELRWVGVFLFYGVIDVLYMLEYALTLTELSYKLFFVFSVMTLAALGRTVVGCWLKDAEYSREEKTIIHFLLENVIFFVMAVAFFSTVPRMYHAFPQAEWSYLLWAVAVVLMVRFAYPVMVYFGSYFLMASGYFLAVRYLDAVLGLPSEWKMLLYTVVTFFAAVAMEQIASAVMGWCRQHTKESS